MPDVHANKSIQLKIKTAFGHAALAYQTNPFKLVRVYLPRLTQKALKEKMQDAHLVRSQHPPQALALADMLERYYLGHRFSIPWKYLDFSLHTPSQSQIYRVVAQIPYGRVKSYSAVAVEADMPKASRFVGNCMARNPYPIIIPCHRVIRGDGSLGGFGGGLDLKQRMLELESGTGYQSA